MEGAGVVTSGQIVATYGAFRLRPLILTTEERGPRQLPYYLVSVQIGPHPEVAFTLTKNLDTSEESATPVILDQLLIDRDIIATYARKYVGKPPAGHYIPRRARATAEQERQWRDRYTWVVLGIAALTADVPLPSAHGPTEKGIPVGSTTSTEHGAVLEIVPPAEETLLASYGAFRVYRVLRAHEWVRPFPHAFWEEPWLVRQEPGVVELRFDGDGSSLPMGRIAEVSRESVIDAVRLWSEAKRRALVLNSAIRQAQEAQTSEINPVLISTTDKNQRDLGAVIAALEALEAEPGE